MRAFTHLHQITYDYDQESMASSPEPSVVDLYVRSGLITSATLEDGRTRVDAGDRWWFVTESPAEVMEAEHPAVSVPASLELVSRYQAFMADVMRRWPLSKPEGAPDEQAEQRWEARNDVIRDILYLARMRGLPEVKNL